MLAPALPPDVAWYLTSWDRQAWSLRIGGEWGLEVALVNANVDGSAWHSIVNRHRGPGLRRYAATASPELARKWAGRWALARLGALRQRAEERARPQGKWVAFPRPAQEAVTGPSTPV